MTHELWKFDELLHAARGELEGKPISPITGVSIDTRTLEPGDIFVALKDQRDGHEFVSKAFAKGASVALVSKAYQRKQEDGPLIKVEDTLASLESIGRAARARLSSEARVFAVTGSVGKTTTKEMLLDVFSGLAPTHASSKSYNNLWGVPLSLARMPAQTRYAIFEIGMNHSGEIMPLTRMVQPDIAIITTVEAVHLENFRSESEIADAKAEIFQGLGVKGSAIINLDNRHWARLFRSAKEHKGCIIGITKEMSAGEAVRSFGVDRAVALRSSHLSSTKSQIEVERSGCEEAISLVLGAPGLHIVMNALFVVAALHEANADVARGAKGLEFFTPPPGRGTRRNLKTDGGTILLIDESYNANPASMRAALKVLSSIPREEYPRRIAVLGDMLELGPEAPRIHEELWEPIDQAGVDLVFASGKNMKRLIQRVPVDRRGAWTETSKELEQKLLDILKAGDVVMVKGSNSSQMGLLTESLVTKFGGSLK